MARLGEVPRPAARTPSAWIVRDRSAAEMPVVVPRRASTVTVKAVVWRSVLSSTISGMRRASSRSPGSATQITPEVCHEERDLLGGRGIGGDDEVAPVLPVVVADHDDGLAGGDGPDGLLDGRRTFGSGGRSAPPVVTSSKRSPVRIAHACA